MLTSSPRDRSVSTSEEYRPASVPASAMRWSGHTERSGCLYASTPAGSLRLRPTLLAIEAGCWRGEAECDLPLRSRLSSAAAVLRCSWPYARSHRTRLGRASFAPRGHFGLLVSPDCPRAVLGDAGLGVNSGRKWLGNRWSRCHEPSLRGTWPGDRISHARFRHPQRGFSPSRKWLRGNGAGGRTRTGTGLPPGDFESHRGGFVKPLAGNDLCHIFLAASGLRH